MRFSQLAAILLATLTQSAPATAQDYPFAGTFTAEGNQNAPDADDPARLTAAISTDATRLPPDKTLELISPDATLLHAPISANLVKSADLSKL